MSKDTLTITIIGQAETMRFRLKTGRFGPQICARSKSLKMILA